MTGVVSALHSLCTVLGAGVLIITAICLTANAAHWLWTRFLEAAGKAYLRKQQRESEKARKAALAEEMRVAAENARIRLGRPRPSKPSGYTRDRTGSEVGHQC